MDVHRKYGAEIRGMRENERQLASRLSEATAERDGLKIACRIQEAALAAASGENAELRERCKKAEDDLESTAAGPPPRQGMAKACGGRRIG